MSLDHLTTGMERERMIKEKADAALTSGRLSKEEYAYFLKKELGIEKQQDVHHEYVKEETIEQRKKQTLFKIAAVLVSFGLLSALLWFNMGGGITAYVTYEPGEVSSPVNIILENNSWEPLNVTNIFGLKVSGSGGNGTLSLLVDDKRIPVLEIALEPETYSVSTPMESYALNESVNVTVKPENVTYTLWLENPSGERNVVQDTFNVSIPGTYNLDALLNDSGNISLKTTSFIVRNETNKSNDIIQENLLEENFTEACEESCSFNGTGNSTLALLWEGEGSVEITELITIEKRANKAPIQYQEIPDVMVNVGDSTTIDLDLYFEDPDNEALTYDYMNAEGVDLLVEGSTLTITGIDVGSHETLIYASDLATLVQSNLFTITVLPSNTNESSNVVDDQNGTIVAPTNNQTNETNNETVEIPEDLCSNPDVNQRPVECLQENYAQYFRPDPIRITDTDRNTIALLTPIGNLKIRGNVIEHANFISNRNDYRIGYNDEYGNYQATIWFDSQTGNLYLRGEVSEENVMNAPAPESFALSNSRGIVLAWADKRSGDLYLRGAILEKRERLE